MTIYDQLGRVSEARVIVNPNDATTDRVTKYVYDDTDRVTMVVTPDPDGSGGNPRRTVQTVYDFLGRVTETIHARSIRPRAKRARHKMTNERRRK